jgi:hypothetical protein
MTGSSGSFTVLKGLAQSVTSFGPTVRRLKQVGISALRC